MLIITIKTRELISSEVLSVTIHLNYIKVSLQNKQELELEQNRN